MLHQDTYERLRRDAEAADRAGLAFGVKLVRGAYLDKERKTARLQGTEDPTQPDYEATSQRWDRGRPASEMNNCCCGCSVAKSCLTL